MNNEVAKSAKEPDAKFCYVAVWNDRHSGVEPFVFSNKENAIEWAKSKVHEYCNYDEDLDEELNDAMIKDDWIYYGRYSCEGDSIYVKKCIIDNVRT